MPNATTDIEAIIKAFVPQLVVAAERQAAERMQAAVTAAFGGATPSAKVGASPFPPSAPSPKHPKLNLGPEALAARRRQGMYLGILRGLPAAKRERVRKVAREQGVAAAINFAASVR